MKRLIQTVLLSMLVSLGAHAGSVEIGVKGMVCSMCAQGIKKKFAALGVENVKVDLDKKRVTLQHDTLPSDGQIKEAIEEAGYAITTIQRK